MIKKSPIENIIIFEREDGSSAFEEEGSPIYAGGTSTFGEMEIGSPYAGGTVAGGIVSKLPSADYDGANKLGSNELSKIKSLIIFEDRDYDIQAKGVDGLSNIIRPKDFISLEYKNDVIAGQIPVGTSPIKAKFFGDYSLN